MRPGWLILLFLVSGIACTSLRAESASPGYVIVPPSSQQLQSDHPQISSIESIEESRYLIRVGESPAFDLEFADVRDQTGTGFDDAFYGNQRRAIAVATFERVSQILAGEPGSARILIDSRSPWLNQDTLAVGIPFFQCIDGFQKPIIHAALRNDTHVHNYEGELLINFDLPLSASMDAPPPGHYDLYTLMFHEITHILGFVGFTVEADGRPRDCGGARMLPAIAKFTRDMAGNPLWTEQDGKIKYLGNPAKLPSAQEPMLLDLPQAVTNDLRLSTGNLRVSGHWLPEDFSERSGGLTGSWVDSQLNGQGFTLHFISESRFVIYFFGFSDSGKKLWMLGLNSQDFELGETITVPLIEASGGQFTHFSLADIAVITLGSA